MGEHLVAHKAAVDIAELLVGTRACGIGQTRAAAHLHMAGLVVHDNRLLEKIGAQHIGQALVHRALLQLLPGGVVGQVCIAAERQGGAPLLDQLALMPDRKAYARAGERMAAHGLDAMGQLGGIGLQKLAPRRRAEEQLLDLHRRAGVAGGGAQLATAGIEQVGALLLGGAREHAHLRDRGNGCQGLAPEPHGRHRFEVMQVADLAGRVAAQRNGQLFARNAAAIVFDGDQPHTTGEQAHGDAGGTCIERIVDQLAHDGGGALDHLAGRDLADQLIGQILDGTARGRSAAATVGCRRQSIVGGVCRVKGGGCGICGHAGILGKAAWHSG